MKSDSARIHVFPDRESIFTVGCASKYGCSVFNVESEKREDVDVLVLELVLLFDAFS